MLRAFKADVYIGKCTHPQKSKQHFKLQNVGENTDQIPISLVHYQNHTWMFLKSAVSFKEAGIQHNGLLFTAILTVVIRKQCVKHFMS